MKISYEELKMDEAKEVEAIAVRVREATAKELRKRGLVVAMSGGIDSSVCAALAVKAVGAGKVHGLILPERDSSSQSEARGKLLAEHLGISYEIQDIAPTLEAIGCYRWRDEAVRKVLPAYSSDWKIKIVISGGLEGQVNHFKLVARSPAGVESEHLLGLKEYLQIVAATNFKQRVRKTIEYFHADRLNYAVVGTPNRLEYDQGFFVKNGDGAADVKPIAHLYKTQVYSLARFMGLPPEICSATPTTDTYSLPQGQDEFYFSLPYDKMDLALLAHNRGVPPEGLASALGVSAERARFIYADIENKRRAARVLHLPAVLARDVPEVGRN